MAKKEQKTEIVRDSITVDWLTNVIGYLAVSKTDGMPKEFEAKREEMANALATWISVQLASVPIVNLCRSLNFAYDNGKTYVNITWNAFGVMNLSVSAQTFGNRWISNLELQGPAFDYEIERPKNMSERFDAVKSECLVKTLEAKISSICGEIENQLGDKSDCFKRSYYARTPLRSATLAYVQTVLTGNTDMKFNNLTTLKKKFINFKSKLAATDSCFARLDEFKQDLMNIMYNPVSMETYIKHCVEETAFTLERFDAYINSPDYDVNSLNWDTRRYLDSMKNAGVHNINDMARLIRSIISGNHDKETEFETLFIRPHGDMRNFYGGLKISEAFADDVQKLFYSNGKVVPPTPNEFCSDSFALLFEKYPEIFRMKKTIDKYSRYYNSTRWNVEISQPMGERFSEYESIAQLYHKVMSQFMTATPNTPNVVHKRYRYNYGRQIEEDENEVEVKIAGSLNMILPSDRLINIMRDICTDTVMPDQTDENDQKDIAYYAFVNNASMAYHELQPALTVNTTEIDISLSEKIELIATNTTSNGFFGEAAMRHILNNVILRTYVLKYIESGSIDKDEYRKCIESCIEKLLGAYDDKITDGLVVCGTDAYNDSLAELNERVNRAISNIETVQKTLLSSDMPDFIEWCASQGFVDKKAAKDRVTQLDAESLEE